MKLKIKRSDVIDALEHESLIVGTWEREYGEDSCGQCAIGALLRRSGLRRKHIADVGHQITRESCSSLSSLPKALKDRNWLGAISIKWEQLGTKLVEQCGLSSKGDLLSKQIDTLREPMIAWVKAKIPNGRLFEGVV